MLFGAILIVVGLALMIFGGRQLLRWQGAGGDDPSGEADWYDSTSGQYSSDPKFPLLYFLGAVLSPIIFGALLVVFGLLQWKWNG